MSHSTDPYDDSYIETILKQDALGCVAALLILVACLYGFNFALSERELAALETQAEMLADFAGYGSAR